MIEAYENAQLLWRGQVVGTVHNIDHDFPHFYGEFNPAPLFDQFREMFEQLTDEDAETDPPVDPEWLPEKTGR